MFIRSVLKIVSISVGVGAVALVAVSLCATEVTRVFVTRIAEAPFSLPDGVDIRYSDRLATLIGKGTPSGRASAITLGFVIIVPERFDRLSLTERHRVILHELVHVEQRRRYGRLYLPSYAVLYLLRGYTDHPFEREAQLASALRRRSGQFADVGDPGESRRKFNANLF